MSSVPANRTTVTELATALGIADAGNPLSSLGLRPAELTNVSDETWCAVSEAFSAPDLYDIVNQAYENGRHFRHARGALRGRHPLSIEWAGPRRAPGDEVTPVDLRIDHVYLVSCKYMSRITVNASPAHIFERLLAGGHGRRGPDWFERCAPSEFAALWSATIDHIGIGGIGGIGMAHRDELPSALSKDARRAVAKSLTFRRWPDELAPHYEALCRRVSQQSALAWRTNIGDDDRAAEAMMWRLLRIGAAPYFVLGSHGNSSMRIRVASPWDWRQMYEFRSLDIESADAGQPTVNWVATYRERSDPSALRSLAGHVEIRWSHGRFAGPPEAKVYVDTAFEEVPGYIPLV